MAVKFLSDDWCQAVAERLNTHQEFLNAIKGKSVTLTRTTTEGPDGDHVYWLRFEDDEARLGLGDVPDADATTTETYETAVGISKGEIDGNEAFMRGKTRASGNVGVIMGLVPAFQAMADALSGMDVEY